MSSLPQEEGEDDSAVRCSQPQNTQVSASRSGRPRVAGRTRQQISLDAAARRQAAAETASARRAQLAAEVESRKQAKEAERISRLVTKEYSVTIQVDGRDLDVDVLWPKLLLFLETECVRGKFSVERGGLLFHLHIQGVITTTITTVVQLKKVMNSYLGLTTSNPLTSANIRPKYLKNKDMHTFVGMVGYTDKDNGLPHFKTAEKGVTQEMLKRGRELFLRSNFISILIYLYI